MITRNQAEAELKRVFGLDHFYDEQWNTIERLLRGERMLLIERTGFGKSLCYQFPALFFDGVTVIFSPLIALMRDQVNSLNSKNISARCINSEQTPEENTQAIQDAKNGLVKILYIAPERQENQEWIEATRQMKLAMIVIDEAHTISVWGHDFRPAFRRIINLVKLLPKDMPVLATTATATLRVQHDIEKQIGGNLKTIRGNLVRDNFHLYVVETKSEEEKMVGLARWIDIHRSKYEQGGDFPDFLLKTVLKAYRKQYRDKTFDLILYVPPTISGNLVKNFAHKVSMALHIPISDQLQKTRETCAQKIFQNSLLKKDNVSGSFTVADSGLIEGKAILLIDDIYDSGATIKEIGRMLTGLGANVIAPLVIARTVGGDDL